MLDSAFPSVPDRSAGPDIAAIVEEIAGVVGAWCPSLSPDGHRIAYVTDRSGLPRLEVAQLDASGEHANAAPRTVSLPDQEVVSVAWAPDGEWLAYLVSPNGLIRAELHAIRPDGSDARVLAGTGELETVFAGCWTSLPHTYAFSMADGTGPDADVCLVDVTSGAVRIVTRGGFHTLTSVSPDGRRFLARRGTRGRRHLVLGDLPGDWTRDIDTAPPAPPMRLLAADFPEPGTDLAEEGRFSPDGTAVYLRTSAGRERAALGVVPLLPDGRPGRMRILAARDDADLESYAILRGAPTDAGSASSGGDLEALLVWNVCGVSEIEMAVLPAAGADLPHTAETSRRVRYRVDIGDRVIPGWSIPGDSRSGILELTEPVAPRSLYHVDLFHPGEPGRKPEIPRRITGLPVPELDPRRLVVPDSITYRSLDGLALQGLLYRPNGVTEPGPTVVLLHGGPESQERPAFSILIQSLAAVGITVFAPNVRGSTGFGGAFTAMDDLARRESSFQDVPATVAFLIAAGIAHPRQIGVHGWSYGGYLALIALTRWPELFASGSSHAGMSDLLSFFRETEPWMAAASVTEYGDPETDRAMLTDLSPLHSLHRVLGPTLLVHGEQDTNVPVGESVRAHAALVAAGVPTDLLLLPGEGHTIVGHDGRISSTRSIVEWHTRWLR